MTKQFLSLLTALLSAHYALATLPGYFQAKIYNMSLQASAASFNSIAGKGTITLTCVAPTSSITLNWGETLSPSISTLTASTFTITMQPDSQTDTKTSVSVDRIDVVNKDTITIVTTTNFIANNIVYLDVNFMTMATKDDKGLVYHQYYNGNTINYILLTNLFPHYSRLVFPCLDHPKYPAQLNLTMIRPSTWSSGCSCSRKASITDVTAGTVTEVFNCSAPMPLYAFSFFMATGLTSNVISQAGSPTKLNWLTPSGWDDSALKKNLEFLSNYVWAIENQLNMPTPGESHNILMVPNLPAAISGNGVVCMRNDTYEGPYNTPQSEGDFKSKIVPFVRMWIEQYSKFSSRPASWSDMWISEATTGYIEYIICNTYSPYDFKTDLGVVALQTAISMETSRSRPLEDPSLDVSSTAVVELALIDPLKKMKGPCLLDMMDMSFPAGTVFSALKSLYKKFKESFITSAQFYLHMINFISNNAGYLSNDDQKALQNMPLWCNTTGTVMVNVTVTKPGDPGTVKMVMRPFCEYTPCTNTIPSICLSVAVSSRSERNDYTFRQDHWLTNTSDGISVSIRNSETDWIIHQDTAGYCVSIYSPSNWQRLTEAISRATNGIKEIKDRSKLIHDAYALAKQGSLSYDIPLRLTISNMDEVLYSHWYPVFIGLNNMRNILLGLPTQYTAFKAFMDPFMKKMVSMMESGTLEPSQHSKIEVLFYDLFCEYNIKSYRDYAATNMTALLKGEQPTTVASEAYDVIVCNGAKYSSNMNITWLWNNITDDSIGYLRRYYYCKALACTPNYTRITELFPTMLNVDIQMKPFVMTVFQTMADVHGVQLMTNLSSIIEPLQKLVGAANTASLISTACKKVNTNAQAAYLAGITNATVDDVVKTAASDCISTVTARAAWLYYNNGTMVNALNANNLEPNKPSAATPVTLLSVTLLVIPFIPVLMTF